MHINIEPETLGHSSIYILPSFHLFLPNALCIFMFPCPCICVLCHGTAHLSKSNPVSHSFSFISSTLLLFSILLQENNLLTLFFPFTT